MASIFQKAARLLNIGKARHIVGYDLAGNAYLELPSLHGSTDPRHTRRMIQWKEKMHHGEYDQRSLPVQWTMWLRHTRRDPPSIHELEQDRARIEMVQHNARVLAIRDQEERQRLQQLRLEEHNLAKQRAQQQKLVASRSAAGAVPTSTVQDVQAEAERQRRVAYEESDPDPQTLHPRGTAEGSDAAFRQERVPDNDVWAASRARLAQQGHAPAPPEQELSSPILDAVQRRKAKRAEFESEESERERARREMSKSPLEAFVPVAKPRR
ncbi:uncharacterized protein PFL1_02760 [Pseudozyma flocculosa PF-1]|uniref:NADH dehydrogenase [ubiquinone] 1 alpha subcomplex subunit n=1 Tax=Pseudozyma flocculosa PF-1 TaxID=1277687 RepID=A0A061HG10_9BASI|nr:uncharacterized protein PFL1_02760 [Pseudozyma flocculosa PF-1]EPQ29541.1 hypothetical protein PFL1_02760 [Pseudozyma flocculosa PF-1]